MDQLKRLKLQLDIQDSEQDELLQDCLDSAEAAILSRRYPYSDEVIALEPRYQGLQVRIAIYLYNKRGAEGQLSHSENGINRTYESADIPESMLKSVTPYVGVL